MQYPNDLPKSSIFDAGKGRPDGCFQNTITSVPGFFLVLPIFGLALFNMYSLNFGEGYNHFVLAPVNIGSYLNTSAQLPYGDSMSFLASMFSLIYCPFIAYRFVSLGVGGRLNVSGYTACIIFLFALVVLLASPVLWHIGFAGVPMSIYFSFCLPCLFLITMFVGVEIWKLKNKLEYELQTAVVSNG